MSDAAATVAAHAKVNLILRVGSRDARGYHPLETVFQRIALADTLTVRLDVKGRALDVLPGDGRDPGESGDARTEAALGPVEQNLAWRAAVAYRDAAGWPDAWALELTKRIPVGAGLGGGSADAAAVLRAFNALAPTPLELHVLLRLAGALGADVPFLVADVSRAIGRGYGERLDMLQPLDRATLIVGVPSYGIHTGGAYGALDSWRGAAADAGQHAPLAAAALRDWPDVAAAQVNDFEPPTFARHPDLADFRRTLEDAGALIARLSGSGSAVFGVWPHAPGTPSDSGTRGSTEPDIAPIPDGMRVFATHTL